MALEKLDIKLDGVGHVLADNFLSVPIYQRSYAWEEEHVKELCADVIDSFKRGDKEYFLGSIVVSELSPPEVVDGQQRLATTSILVAAIRDHFFAMGDTGRATGLDQKYLQERDIRTQEVTPKLLLNLSDRDFYQRKVLAAPGHADRTVKATRTSHTRIEVAAKTAEAQVKAFCHGERDPSKSLLDLIEFIERQAKIIVVRVPDHANAFLIFETLNDRGLDLSVSDLLKNYIFSLSGDRLNEARDAWSRMLGALESVNSGELTVKFVRHMWSSQWGPTRERELYARIKGRVKTKKLVVELANDLAENAIRYAALVNPQHELWQPYGATARGHVETLLRLGMEQVRPLQLAMLKHFSVAHVQASLRLMVAWSVRFLITGGGGGGVMETQYAQRAMEVRDGRVKTAKELATAMSSVVATDQEFEIAFSGARVSKNDLARYYLRVLEAQKRGDKSPEFVPNSNEEVVNLEHVMPQSLSSAWTRVDADTADAYVKRIGNLALLKNKINEAAGNDGFAQKKLHYKNSEFALTADLARFKAWGPQEVEKRQKVLAKLAVDAWSLTV